jgi:septum formation protein
VAEVARAGAAHRGAPLVLASASPRRRALLARLGVTFEVRAADIDETPRAGEPPTAYVERLARAKATERAAPDEVVIGADTIVDLDGTIVGKPADAAAAIETLRRLSGRAHLVHTGVAVAHDGRPVSSTTTSTVRFRALSRREIEDYVATGHPLDKAGGYGLQGPSSTFVERIEGSASNVVGLPVAQTVALVAATGVDLVHWGPPR